MHPPFFSALIVIALHFFMNNPYIISEDEALFNKHLTDSGLAPASIKIMRSDTRFLFKWLLSQKKNITISGLIEKYEEFLIDSKQNEYTMRRRLATVKRFSNWYNSIHPQQTLAESATQPQMVFSRRGSETFSTSIRRYSYVSILLLILLISYVLLSRLFSYGTQNKSMLSNNTRNVGKVVMFNLTFANENELIRVTKYPLTFNFYSDIYGNSYIGNTICKVTPPLTSNDDSRLSINLNTDCGSPLNSITQYLDSGNELFVDIIANNVTLNSSKVHVTTQNDTLAKSNYQNSTKDISLTNSISDDYLLNEQIKDDQIRYFETFISSSSGKLNQGISLQTIASGDTFLDGEVVGLYNGRFDKALLSTKVVGVVSNGFIRTQGIVEVNMNNQPNIINPGDAISTSLDPGYAQKSINATDAIIGVAIEQYATNSGKLKILINIE